MTQTKTYGLQRETRAYLRRLRAAGRVLEQSSIADIDDFVRGMKEIGVWQYVVDGWFLNQDHNINTGNAVMGIVSLNGVLAGGPTREGGGVYFTNNSQFIDLGNGLDFYEKRGLREFCHISALKTDSSVHNSHVVGIEAWVSNNPTTGYVHAIWGPTGNRVLTHGSLTGGSRSWGNANNTNVGIGPYFASAGISNLIDPSVAVGFTDHNNLRNTSKSGSGTFPRTFVGNRFWIFGRGGAVTETAYFQIWFNKMLDLNSASLVRLVAKNTIAKNLNLP
jgi:hypothetical protein